MIALDGRDLRTFKQSAIRRATGVVLEAPLLLNGLAQLIPRGGR